MTIYLLLITTFCLDMITLIKSKNHKDKIPYIIAMVCVTIVCFVYEIYGKDFELAKGVLEILNIKGGK
ncbi:MAG: hypothetical protein IKV94_03435 [Clostridia bacterium]|nr:hypothetical protein [Clostridia bacterium]